MPINGLTPISQNKTWIPDANQWTYTSLTKQRKQMQEARGNKLPINGLTLDSKEMGCQSMVLVPTPTRS